MTGWGVALLSFGAGWVLHSWCHFIWRDKTVVELARVNLDLREYVATLERELKERERVIAELKEKIETAFEFGRMVEHERRGDGS